MKASPNLNIIIKSVLETGKKLLRDFNEIETLQSSIKGTDEFAKRSYNKAEEKIFTHLSNARPKYNIKSGSGKEKEGIDIAHSYIVDPINGFRNFIRGIPNFVVSIALLEQKDIICAAIYNPISDELYYGEKGEGAFVKGARKTFRLRVSKRKTNLLSNQEISLDAKALELAYLAAGKMDNIEYENFDMCEVAAGMLLAKEAGAKIIPAETPLADVIKENKITLSN